MAGSNGLTKRLVSASFFLLSASFRHFIMPLPPRPTESHPAHHHITQKTTKPTSQLPGCLLRLFLQHGPLESPSKTQATTPVSFDPSPSLPSLPPSFTTQTHTAMATRPQEGQDQATKRVIQGLKDIYKSTILPLEQVWREGG